MKILVLSDSHGNVFAVRDAICCECPDVVLFCGDGLADIAMYQKEYPDITFRCVRGNCDRMLKELDEDEFVLCGKRFYMTHGHIQGVKYSTDSLVTAALYRETDYVLYGHTHRDSIETIENLTVINPGSIGMGAKTYAVIILGEGPASAEIKVLPRT